MPKTRITIFKQMKQNGEKITMITAYDAATAEIVDSAGIDSVLVGDSVRNVIQVRENTLGVTLEEMIYHTKIVSRGIKNAHLAADMPFLSYQVSVEDAVNNAGRLIKEGNAESVKLEVNEEYIDTVYALNKASIPVVAHIGLCPQSLHVMGGYKVQGRNNADAEQMLHLAHLAEDAGAFLLVLESIPAKLATIITSSLSIPTIGIGAGNRCDGQVLVFNDMAGLSPEPLPKFVNKFADGRKIFLKATEKYIEQVKSRKFPTKKNSYE